jgi:hypothetical protein
MFWRSGNGRIEPGAGQQHIQADLPADRGQLRWRIQVPVEAIAELAVVKELEP